MRILVIGASQGTGALAVKAALDRGHEVTAFARSPQNLVLEHPKLTRVAGDFHQQASVEAAVPGHDAVLVTASSLKGFKDNPAYFSMGTGLVIEAMKRAGSKRLVILSALGAGDSAPLLNPLLRLLMRGLFLKAAYADHDRQEALVRESGLEWIIARPTRLTDGPALGKYMKTKALISVPSAISRADVAAFMIEAAEAHDFVGQAVQLGG